MFIYIKKVQSLFHQSFWENSYIEIHIHFYQSQYPFNFFDIIYQKVQLLDDVFQLVFYMYYLFA